MRKKLILVAAEYDTNKKLSEESEAIVPRLRQDTPREMTSDYLCLNVRPLPPVQKLHETLDEKKSDIIKKVSRLQEDMRRIGASIV